MKREKFLNSLELVMYGAESSFSDFNLIYFEDGWLRGFNNRMYVSCPVGSSFSCQVDIKILHKILTKMNEKNVRIRFKDGILLVDGRKSKLQLKTLEGEKIPTSFKKLPKENFLPLPEDFLKGMQLTYTSAAADNLVFGVLSGVCVDGNGIIACDNFRVSHYKMSGDVKPSFVMPSKSVSDLLRSKLSITEYFVDDSWIHFLDVEEGIIISSILLEDEYPVEKILKVLKQKEWKETVITLPTDLSDAVDRASVLSSETTDNIPFITLKMSKEKIEILGDREFATYKEVLSWSGFGDEKDISIKATPSFLKEILKVTSELKISEDNTALLFSTDEFEHLVLTVKASDGPYS